VCAHVRVVRGNPAGAQQVADRALEGGRVEALWRGMPMSKAGSVAWVVAAAVGHGGLRFSAVGLVIIHAVAGRSSRLVVRLWIHHAVAAIVISLDAASHAGL
jgi:hypothetical protein